MEATNQNLVASIHFDRTHMRVNSAQQAAQRLISKASCN